METNNKRKGFENLLPQYNVEGFNPNDVLTLIEDIDENGQPAEFLYMEFVAALRWFYTVFPTGRMDYDIITFNDKKIVVKGKIFRDINDAMPAATALVSRYYTEDAHGKYFEQNAVTAAYRKALEYLGFGTPPDAVKTENTLVRSKDDIPERGEPGVMIPRPILPVTDTDMPVTQPEVEKEPKKKTCKTAKAAPVSAPVQAAVQEKIEVSTSAPAPTPVQAPTPASAQKAETKPENWMPTFEEALKCIVPYGSLAGKTIEEAAKIKGDEFIRYHCDRAQKDTEFYKATSIYCQYRGC